MAQKLRCAIYTRKSSEEGLDQEFNSLHAQRESCEAYIKSQAGEGWGLIATGYDDGAYSGGTMERPALKQLLADVAAGKIDVVVVYKVDRLTRALADFAKIVEIFDARGVSFVSVTQAFNTTTSMGRLTLNVLLSFAQFEREVTGERIRDKIAASKAKGMWMGGLPSLGYDVKARTLVINDEEARIVRHIFQRYLELPSVKALASELREAGIRSKSWTTLKGRAMGGVLMGTGALFHILSSRIYIGQIVHKDQSYAGLHQAIISPHLFEAVAERLKARSVRRRSPGGRVASAALTGLLFDGGGRPLTPSFSYGRSGRLYRYYMTTQSQADPSDPNAIRRVSAPAIEAFLVEQMQRIAGKAHLDPSDLSAVLRRVELRSGETHLVIHLNELLTGEHPELALSAIRRRLHPGEQAVLESTTPPIVRVVLNRRMQLRGGASSVLGVTSGGRRKVDPLLVNALKRAHSEIATLKASPFTSALEIKNARAPPTHHGRKMAQLAYLSPDLQRRILDGQAGSGLTPIKLLKAEMPLAWADQVPWLEAFDER